MENLYPRISAFLFFFSCFISDSSAAMVNSELETLFLVMEAVSSDRDWRSANPNPCSPGYSLPGIECSTAEDGFYHVARLDFGTPLNPSCKVDAIFPSLIFSLPHLHSVFFYECFTSHETRLSIPSISTKLQQLSLMSNPALKGPIPAQISNLRSLRVLTLSQNQLHGSIPETISSLTDLVHLDLSYNSLSGFIPGLLMSNLGKLVGLDLSYNALSGPIPAMTGNLGSLQKLDLSSNSLSGAIPESLEYLGSISFIALSGNNLSGPLPGGLHKLSNLQYLIMEDNPMRIQLPEQLGKLEKLQELRLANSALWGPIPQTFSLLRNLTTLSLQNNRLSGCIPAGLGNLQRIFYLNISRNELRGVVPFNSNFLRRLGRNLDLRGNQGLCLENSSVAVSFDLGVGLCGGQTQNATQAEEMQSGSAQSLILATSWFLLAAWIVLF